MTLSTIRGSNLSESCPPKIANTPIMNIASAMKDEIRARDQPNSASNALKKTPNEIRSPITMNWIVHAPSTIK